ncbi:unnamed protein product [Didymodactylos carnosus]|uniref:Dynamin stalk domain-containing protein n=1 Tax=Didymodactylos carnosus TaxID=1234261 RepID=A0A814P4W7_9BILA|nr:unnamed protein product [Didymodactylos carnosus]CAF1127880.1 unnamed protein product [Didymodactylos carnosus]CAF3866164.1 unnamed protein product [Didymodactylos carnosus]CAF3907741.1 unnamed protein product [Didymodactylos carnosus]
MNSAHDDRIAYQFYTIEKRFQDKIIASFSNFFTPTYASMILKLLDENAGVALPNFSSFHIIETLYRKEQHKLKEPCHTLLKQLAEYLKNILLYLLGGDNTYDYHFIDRFTHTIITEIKLMEKQCLIDINKQLDIEQRIFTLNHYYMDTVK